ncbi:hypothetical protein KFL_014120020 [Klebsormidium nitens]|uniref:Uncharacterized protein n=1 Tax=Klebsormidium nitens TaxID=105231 RepID=A0A1Y1IQZ9_KLENI|nr:hypothetical protein KFL_014120020 [Klebsormidium nitens]|eukprot:GAQ93280.1 hypothetical protein KFL_014120020 [Klebsormidium nitens]
MTQPHEFAPGAYYFWLNPLDFLMAGWLCRGVADVPDDIVKSRVLKRLTPGQCFTVFNQWNASPSSTSGKLPPAPTLRRTTRGPVVQREWMGNYFHADDESGRCNFSPPAIAIIRRIPLPGDAIIGQGPNTAPLLPLYWACHSRPAHVQLPRHRILDRRPLHRRSAPPRRGAVLRRHVSAPRAHLLRRARRALGGTRPLTGGHPTGARARRRPRAAPSPGGSACGGRLQEVAVAEAVQPPAPAPAPAKRPPPRRPSRQSRPGPQRGAQAAAATPPSTGVDYSAIFNTAARGASAADTLQAAILRLLNSLAEQPFPSPDPIWGTRRQLTNELLATPDLQPSNRRASMGNIPVIDNLCQLISATSRADTGLAQHVCAFLQRFLATGARAGPPVGGHPRAPGGRGPPRDDYGAGGRGHSSLADQRDNGGGGRGGGRDRRSPPSDDGAKRMRLGDGEQDAEEPHRESRQRARKRAPSPPDRSARSVLVALSTVV